MATNCHGLIGPLSSPTEIEPLFPHDSNTKDRLMGLDLGNVLRMGRSGPCVYTGRDDPLERERDTMQEGWAMAKGTKTYRLGAAGKIIKTQSEKGLLSSPHLPAVGRSR